MNVVISDDQIKKQGWTPVLKSRKVFFRHRVGLHILGKPSYRAWTVCGERLARDRTSIQWAMGDWALYGENRGDWGETYAQAVNILQYSEQTIQNHVWVANRFKISRRREKLSYTHHAVIAAIKADAVQDKLLDLAIANGWGSRYLAEVAAPYKPDYVEPDEGGDDGDSEPRPTPLVFEGSAEEAVKWLNKAMVRTPRSTLVHMDLYLIPVALPRVPTEN